jgi:hypothetical protein
MMDVWLHNTNVSAMHQNNTAGTLLDHVSLLGTSGEFRRKASAMPIS